jgi:hypothetical protein
MTALYYSTQDPFFFLLHGNVDKLWSEWQRNTSLPAGITYGSRFDPSIVTSPSTQKPVAVAFGGTQNVMSAPMAPWNGYDLNGTTGTQPTIPIPPWAIGGPYTSSKTANDPSIIFPAVYDVAPLTVPVLKQGESVVIEIPWYPPNPQSYASGPCLSSGQLHTCLLARIVSTEGPGVDGMDTTEQTTGNDLGYNVTNNRRVAQHNEEVVDPPGPLLGGAVLVRNVLTNAATYQLSVSLRGMNTNLLNYAQIVLDLGVLYNSWQTNGAAAQGFTPAAGTQLLLTGTTGVLSNIRLAPNQAAAVQVQLYLTDGYPDPQGQVFSANFAQTIQGPTNQVVGGQRFTFDFNQLTLVPKSGTWRYISTNQIPSSWKQVGYNDSSWSSGAGLLGYGLGGEDSVISANSFITTYFRYDFGLQDPALYRNLWLQLQAYDGAVVYLNGVQIAQLRMPTNTITPFTLATSVATNFATKQSFVFNVSGAELLLSGTNVLAVEVHKGATNGPDLGLDGALIANIGAGNAGASNFPPQVAFQPPSDSGIYLHGQDVRLAANVFGPLNPVTSVSFYGDRQLIHTATVPPYTATWTNPPVGMHQVTAVAIDSAGVTANDYLAVPVVTNIPPTIILTNPSPGRLFAVNSSFSLGATAQESGGTIASVSFYYSLHGPGFDNPQILIGTSTTAPYSVSLAGGLPPGCYMLTAVATDTYGVSSYSVPIPIFVLGNPTLTINYARPFVILNWSPTNAFLQQASSVTGPWQTVTNASTPYGFIPGAPRMYFRAGINPDAICRPQ